MLPTAGNSVSSGTGAFVIRGGTVTGGRYNGAAGASLLFVHHSTIVVSLLVLAVSPTVQPATHVFLVWQQWHCVYVHAQ
jgi:hypothetical protein